ncbi:MAG: tRNA preQ1(34) S-adenosylmethionine ribosyltransferase-isomerase QueA [Nitrospirae bacterium]|nr:MAG: tRNA preQ1(34) S-adenosylmethionine ribosyltransferase-isomerase QueA [Nitrospirota bacterium]
MYLNEFQFPFDASLIADRPVKPRDHARLLIVPREQGPYKDRQVFDLPELLHPGDLVVVNDTKVIPARVIGYKNPGGGKIEVLFVRAIQPGTWEVLLKGKVRTGQLLQFSTDVQAMVAERSSTRTIIHFPDERSCQRLLKERGQMPLPPYIKREPTEEDRSDYQTVFAKVEGAVAAPTAGLHFTERLLNALQARGITLASITLHVGPGTFRPVTSPMIDEHRMEPEWYCIPEHTAHTISLVRQHGGRVVAIGTTVTRALEAAADGSGIVRAGAGETNLFIRPGFHFQVVDGILTNFHLPGTTLIMLVAAFAGLERARAAYEHAVRTRYRFYSYGDAMLII